MDVRYVNPFIKSVRNVFGTMLSVDVTFDKPHARSPDDPSDDVSGIIGFSGDATGAVVVSFPRDTAGRVVTRFAGVELGIDDADFSDAIGELANMIAGGAKSEFEGLDISISLPSVIIGKRHELGSSATHPHLVIPCRSELGAFQVSVTMKVEESAMAMVGTAL